MNLQLTNSYSKAYVEILEIIKWMDNESKKKIPVKLINYFEENRDLNYTYSLTDLKSGKNFLKETFILLVFLELNYLASDYERDILNKSLKENEKKHQENLKILYNPDNLFKNKKKDQNLIKDEKIVENVITKYKKKKLLQKIFDRIINVFRKKN